MRFAISAPNMGSAAGVVELGRMADDAGWDGFFVWDHLHFRREARVDVHDPWVLLGALATVTRRVRLGALVTPVARRRPWKLAKEVVTLDHLSSGRAVVGVGLGEPGDEEFGTFGDPPDARVRAARLDEGLDVLTGLWTAAPYHFAGEHFQVDAELHPAPLQQPRPPVWVAGKWPNRAPFLRAQRWDGFVPTAPDGGPVTPDLVAEISTAIGPRDGFDLVATAMDDVAAAEYAEAGATWIVYSTWPIGDWQDALRGTIETRAPG